MEKHGDEKERDRERDDHGIIRKSRFYHDGGAGKGGGGSAKEQRGKRERGWDARRGCWTTTTRERKKGAGKKSKSERERYKCKTTRGGVLARTYGRAIIYWRVGTSEGSGVRAGRVVLHSRGC